MSSIVLWSFSYHICVIDFWPVFLHWSYQISLILKLVLGCVSKFSVVCIQTIHTDFLSLQVVESCIVVLVGFSDLFASIYCFDWSKISFELFVQAFFCWLLTCVYHIYWIRVNWSWNLTLVVLTNCMWVVSKPDILICSPCRFVEVCGEGTGFCDSPVIINTLIVSKEIAQVFCLILIYKPHRILFLVLEL